MHIVLMDDDETLVRTLQQAAEPGRGIRSQVLLRRGS